LAETGASMPVDLAAWSAARVAEGLHYAHEFKTLQGESLQIIHRDVNPTNIIVTYDGKVKLIDFGLAKSMGRLTRSAEGIVKGKVPYLSPEQATGNAIDRRTDVYTLGITLWEATTGKRLFKREDDVATIRAIQKAEVPDPRKDDPTYPEALWKIVDKALAVKPDDRYPTAKAFADDLNTFLAAREATDLEPDMTKFMSDLFPGEESKQLAWLTDATTHERPQPNLTLPPPVAVGEIEAAVLRESLAKAKAANEAAAKEAGETKSEPPAAVTDAKSKGKEALSKKATTEAAKPPVKVASKVEAKAKPNAIEIPMRLWVAAAALAVLLTMVALLSRG
ncbi:MAG: serine/threonine-protein kinase, partial [Polyangiaceae bacterium]